MSPCLSDPKAVCVIALQASGSASADLLVNGKGLGRGGLYGESEPLAPPPVRTADLEAPVQGFWAGGGWLQLQQARPTEPHPGFPVAFPNGSC